MISNRAKFLSHGNLLKVLRKRFHRRRWPKLFIPISRGPLQNFFHFFFGYFVPLYYWQITNPLEKTVAISIPPHSQWLPLLPLEPVKQLDGLKAMKHSFVGAKSGYSDEYRIEGVFGWDKWERFNSRPLKEVSTHILSRYSAGRLGDASSQIDVLLLSREFRPAYYETQNPTAYGSKKRNIPNLVELQKVLEVEAKCRILDPASVPPEEAIAIVSGVKILIGQHGAGLTNCFFLPEGSQVWEICWPGLLETEYSRIYPLLCEALGLRYKRLVLQENAFSTIDVEYVQQLVLRELPR